MKATSASVSMREESDDEKEKECMPLLKETSRGVKEWGKKEEGWKKTNIQILGEREDEGRRRRRNAIKEGWRKPSIVSSSLTTRRNSKKDREKNTNEEDERE